MGWPDACSDIGQLGVSSKMRHTLAGSSSGILSTSAGKHSFGKLGECLEKSRESTEVLTTTIKNVGLFYEYPSSEMETSTPLNNDGVSR